MFFWRFKSTASSILSRSCPLRPTNGSPFRSSCSPGPSPMNRISAFYFQRQTPGWSARNTNHIFGIPCRRPPTHPTSGTCFSSLYPGLNPISFVSDYYNTKYSPGKEGNSVEFSCVLRYNKAITHCFKRQAAYLIRFRRWMI